MMLALVERPRPHHPAAEAPVVRSQSLSKVSTSKRTTSSGSSVPNFDRLLQSFEKRLLSSKRFSYVSTLWRRGIHKDASRSNNLDKLLFEFYRAHNRDDDLLTHILRREWKEIGGDTLEDFLRRSQTTALSERLLDHFFGSRECKSYSEKLLGSHVEKIFHIVQEAQQSKAPASQLVCRMSDVCAEILQSFCTSSLKDIPLDIRKVAVAVAEVCSDKPTAVGAVSCALFGMFVGDALFDVAQSMVDDDYTQDDCDVVEGQLYVCEMIMRSVASLQLDPELEKLVDNRAQEYLVSNVIDKLGREVLKFVYKLCDPASYVIQLVEAASPSREALLGGGCTTPRRGHGGEETQSPQFAARLAALKQLTLFCYSHGILESSASSRVHDSECMSNPGSDGGADSPVSPPRSRSARSENDGPDIPMNLASALSGLDADDSVGGEECRPPRSGTIPVLHITRALLESVPE